MLPLFNPKNIVFSNVGLTNGPRAQIHNLVAVLVDLRVQFRDTRVCPIFAKHW